MFKVQTPSFRSKFADANIPCIVLVVTVKISILGLKSSSVSSDNMAKLESCISLLDRARKTFIATFALCTISTTTSYAVQASTCVYRDVCHSLSFRNMSKLHVQHSIRFGHRKLIKIPCFFCRHSFSSASRCAVGPKRCKVKGFSSSRSQTYAWLKP